jgi:hypothetical protein
MKGAAEKAAMGTPRSSFLQRSASVPPTSVMGAENAIPSINLHTMRVPMFLETAHGMMKTTAIKSVDPLASRMSATWGHTSLWPLSMGGVREIVLDDASPENL